MTVVVPTICRPAELAACLESLAGQTRRPDAVVVVLPSSATPCDEVVRSASRDLDVAVARGSERGIVAAVNAGLAEVPGGVVALLDDDATAPPEWVAGIARWFRDPCVGAVGGPHVPPGGRLEDLPPTDRWDRLTWFGYSDGPRTWARTPGPRPAHFFGESSLAFRRELVDRIDTNLVGRDERFGDDVTFVALRRGLRCVADPALYVRHAHVRFDFDPGRVPAAEHVEAVAHNQTYLWCKHLPPARRAAFLAFGFLVGDRSVKGLGAFVVWIARNLRRPRRALAVARLIGPTLRGRLAGLRTLRRAGGGGRG